MQIALGTLRHPVFWTNDDWQKTVTISQSYLILHINHETIIVDVHKRHYLIVRKQDQELLDIFITLIIIGTADGYASAMEIKDILLQIFDLQLINQVEQEAIACLIYSKLIH